MSNTQRRTKKPIPRSHKGWSNEAHGVWVFLKKLHSPKLKADKVWKDKMRVYYTKRMLDLLEYKPPTLQPDIVMMTWVENNLCRDC